jgi:2-methylcitrate dehydratase PrpD
MSEPGTLIEQIAQHLQRPVDAATRERARLHLLDWLGCVAGARFSEVGQLDFPNAIDNVLSKAAFLGNVLEMDDVHRTALLHPGPVIWPSVLGGLNGDEDVWLDAAVRGYEAMIAVGSMFDAHHYAHFHPTATAGVFGAAAAAASLLDCDSEQTASALALSGSVTGGVWQTRHEAVMAKQWHVAHAVITGGSAAFFARQGVTGPRYILEGPQGVFAATCRDPKPLVLGSGWRLGEVSFKPWAACRHTHPAIDAALELRARGALLGPVTIETYADALTFCDRANPVTVGDAKFSLQHAVAVVIARGEPTPADFELDAIAALASTRAQISVVEDPALTATYPAHFGATVKTTHDSITLSDTCGDPERPLSREGIIAKAQQLMMLGGLTQTNADHAVRTAFEDIDGEGVVALLELWL